MQLAIASDNEILKDQEILQPLAELAEQYKSELHIIHVGPEISLTIRKSEKKKWYPAFENVPLHLHNIKGEFYF